MLGKEYFYHKSIRKMIAIFGTLFNNIIIRRHDANDVELDSFQVPLAYAPRQKWLSRIQEDYKIIDSETGEGTPRVQIALPRMAYDLTDISYDPARKTSSLIKCRSKDATNNEVLSWIHNPIPYSFLFTLNIATVTQTDSLQILEQILPFFRPQFNISVNEFPGFDIVRDIPITFQGSATPNDTFEGDLLERKLVTYTLSFTLKGYIYGPIESSKVIRDAIVNANITNEFDNLTIGQTERTQVFPEPILADADDEFHFKIIRTSII